MPDRSRLDPGVLQVPPFEVVSGAQAADLRTRTHRLFQYDYVLRYLGEQIGGDIEVPGATITYRVQSRVQGDAAVESRDRQYILPSTTDPCGLPRSGSGKRHPRRAAADVPGDRGAALSRQPAANRLLGPARRGGVMVAWALAALIRRPREAGAAARPVAREAAVLRAASRELEQVRRQRQVDGWTADLAARALAALRLAGSYMLRRPVAQTLATTGTVPATGQLRVPRSCQEGAA